MAVLDEVVRLRNRIAWFEEQLSHFVRALGETSEIVSRHGSAIRRAPWICLLCMMVSCYRAAMSTFQIRRLPQDLKDRLRERARKHRTTMSEYVLSLLRESLERPEPDELLARLRSLEPVELGIPAATLLQECRAGREPDGHKR